MAEIQFFGYLAEKVGHKSLELILEKPIRLRDICHLPFAEENILILIEPFGQHIEKLGHLDSLIEDTDLVSIMPILTGG